jgi:hypothetical protein
MTPRSPAPSCKDWGSAGWVGRSLLFLLGVAVATTGCVDGWGRPGRSGDASSSRPVRQLHEVPWDTVFHLSMAPDDTLFYGIDGVRADGERIWVLDRLARRVTVLDWNGRWLRQVGREGAGPGEFLHPQRMELDDRGWVWVFDEGTGRLSTFDLDGVLRQELSLRHLGASLGAFVPEGSGPSILGVTHERGLQLVRIDEKGDVSSVVPLPAPETSRVWGFAFQGHAHRGVGSSKWVFAFSSGDGWFLLDSLGVVGGRRLYPEAVTFPTMVEEVARQGEVTHTIRRLSEPRFAALSVAVTRDRVWMAFAGEGPQRGRLLEEYDLATGAYRRSLLLPRPGRVFVWENRVLLYANDPLPELLVLRLPDP